MAKCAAQKMGAIGLGAHIRGPLCWPAVPKLQLEAFPARPVDMEGKIPGACLLPN